MKLKLFLLLTLLTTILLANDNVLVIKSKNLQIYDDVVTGFLIETKAKTKLISIEDKKEEEILDEISKHNLVFVIGNKALNIASKQNNVPILFSMVPNYNEEAYKNKKITGVRMNLSPKTQLNVISSLFNLKKIGIVQGSKKTEEMIDLYMQIADLYSIELVRIEANEKNLYSKLEKNKNKFDMLWMLPDRVILNPKSYNSLTKFSIVNKKPLYVLSGSLVERNGLISLTPNYVLIGKQVGIISNKIIKDKVPIKFIPPVSPDSFSVLINYSTAKKIGIIDEFSKQILKLAASRDLPIKVVQ